MIWGWSDGSRCCVQWDNRECQLNELPVWEAISGEYTLPSSEFLDSVRSFDQRFIQAMEQRVAVVADGHMGLNSRIDIGSLRLAHQRHAHALQDALGTSVSRQGTDWGRVIAAIRYMESLPPFATGNTISLR